ncbi:YcaO-like family protein [Paenarthrobacter sp. S56]|uniref:YcaO-like family protein n=1 Tax=Paenarthrobacter sp. S56 TaxID=3138179 RepID=UPI00321A8F02
MSVDPLQTLDPALGLVTESKVYLPNEAGLWRTVATLANSGPANAGAANSGFASAVGAFDVRRRGSLVRAAGEAVERFALVPSRTDAAHLLAADQPGNRMDFVTAGLGRASALAYEVPWYRSVDLLTGQESVVPAPVVDYQAGAAAAGPWERFFDPSPNGAASGPSRAFAQISALAEVIERDAFLSAWYRLEPLQKAEFGELPDSATGLALKVLAGTARAARVSFTLAFVRPEAEAPLLTAVCTVIGAAGAAPFGAVGLKAAADPAAALLGALQEGLQIRELFLSRQPTDFHPGDSVTDDSTRADFWSTAPAVAALRDWTQTFRTLPMPDERPVPDAGGLVKYLAGRQITSHWVDLTHRLPVAVRDLGWETGKAVCPGAIPLTMDESKGLSLLRPGTPRSNQLPHPLI